MDIRQIALVAHELKPRVDELCSILELKVSFNDPGIGIFGLENAVLPVGRTFLEVLAPVQQSTAAGRFLEKRGEGGYMVIIQTDDLTRDRRRLDTMGVRIVWEIEEEGIKAIHLHPRDVGGAMVALEWMDPPESWKWAGPDWRSYVTTRRVKRIAGIALQSKKPEELAARWSEVLGVPHTRIMGEYRIQLDKTHVSFVRSPDSQSEGLLRVDLEAADRKSILRTARKAALETSDEEVQLCGTRFRLME